MTSKEKTACRKYMAALMADKNTKFSIYPLYKDGFLNWLVFRQLMFKYFGKTHDKDRFSKDEFAVITKWAEKYKKKRDRELKNKSN